MDAALALSRIFRSAIDLYVGRSVSGGRVGWGKLLTMESLVMEVMVGEKVVTTVI